MRGALDGWNARALGAALIICSGACGTAEEQIPSSPLVVIPAMYVRERMALSEIKDGDAIDLLLPPQGGHVLFIGAKVRGGRGGAALLRAQLLDLKSGALLAEDGRTVTLGGAGEPDLWQPDLRSFANVANIPVCPAYSNVDLHGQPLMLQVQVTELVTQRSGTATRRAVPSCRQEGAAERALCECECAAGFQPGKCGTGLR